MTKLTPFGTALRKLRIDREMRLFDLAGKLGKSTAMLSAIETGRKAIPDGFVADVVREMALSAAEHKELRTAKDKTLKEVRVDHLSPSGRELVAAFARNASDIPEDLLQEIRNAIFKSCDIDQPFKRKRAGIKVHPMSKYKIEALAHNIRKSFGCEKVNVFPIIEVLEFGIPKISEGFLFEIFDEDVMGEDEGRVIAGQNGLALRTDVYDGACRGEGRGRFTAAHELGHYIMHNKITFARMRSETDPIYCDAEWQADSFAGNLMIPRDLVENFTCATRVSDAFKTSEHAARVMLAKYKQ